MSRRAWWITGFLSITTLAVAGELVAAFDHADWTVPWTWLLTDLPPWVTLPAALLLSIWLPLHLIHWYRLRRAAPTGGSTMTSPIPAQPTTAADARNRAIRTFAQGLGIDVAAGVLLAAGPSLADAHFAWTRTYWITLGLLVAKSVVQSAVAYVARKVVPPMP